MDFIVINSHEKGSLQNDKYYQNSQDHALSQDHVTGWPKLAIVNFLGVLFFKEDHNILRLEP